MMHWTVLWIILMASNVMKYYFVLVGIIPWGPMGVIKGISYSLSQQSNLYKQICCLWGEADMPLFETKSKTCMTSAHKRVTALKFDTAVVHSSILFSTKETAV